tara:strand:- start:42506 stop:43189 length:684 start_codon:yes stop_codon:yes gene_type:complete
MSDMKRVITSLVFLISVVASAQDVIEKSVEAFTELKVYDLIEVEMVKASENKITITGKNKDDLQVVNKNGTLKIRMNLEQIFDGKQTKVTLYYTHVDIIDANEGANIHSKDVIKQFEIDLRAQEGAKIDAHIDVDYVNIKSVSGGYIEAVGRATNQDISVLTGGTCDAQTLETEKTEVDIKAAGEVHIKASKQLDIKIKAGGNVYVYGKPESVNESRVFGGRVTYMD